MLGPDAGCFAAFGYLPFPFVCRLSAATSALTSLEATLAAFRQLGKLSAANCLYITIYPPINIYI